MMFRIGPKLAIRDDIPDSKLPGELIDSISSFTYDVTSRILQLQLRPPQQQHHRWVMSPYLSSLRRVPLKSGRLQQIPIQTFQQQSCQHIRLGFCPLSMLAPTSFPLHAPRPLAPLSPPPRFFLSGPKKPISATGPFVGNTDRLPYSKIPIHLRSLGTFSFDDATRVLTFNYNDTTPTLQTRTITLPNYLTAADVADFDIHDSVADEGSVQNPDRFIFSNENVAGDPTQYTRADDLADYVIDQIVEADLPPSIARDAEIEAWALTANSSTDIPNSKINSVVTNLPSITFNTNTNVLRVNASLTSGLTGTTDVTLPDWITAAQVPTNLSGISNFYLQCKPASALLSRQTVATAQALPIRLRSRSGLRSTTSSIGPKRATPTTFPKTRSPACPPARLSASANM